MPHDVLYSKPPPLAQAPLSNRSSHSQIMSSLTESENLRGPSGETDEGKPPLQSLPISPVHRVSLETLSNIFLLVKGSYEWSGREDWEWLVVTHVCRTWRQAAMNMCQLGRDPDNSPTVPRPFLSILGFSPDNFHDLQVYVQGTPSRIRALRVIVNSETVPAPLFLPGNLCSSASVADLELDTCLPTSWDAPLYSSPLTHLAHKAWTDYPVHRMPTIKNVTDLLSSTVSLETLELQNIFPVHSLNTGYPSISLPDSLRSLVVLSLDRHTRQRDCLLFVAHIHVNHDIHLDVMIDEPPDGGATTPQDLLPLIPVAINNLYQQQSPPTHLIFGKGSLFTHNSQLSEMHEHAPVCAEEPVMFSDMPDVTSGLTFTFDLSTARPISWNQTTLPLINTRTLSFTHPGNACLQDQAWWKTMTGARGVSSMSLCISDCAMLSPIGEVIWNNNSTEFTLFPHLKALYIHVDYAFDISKSRSEEQRCEGSLSALKSLVRSRRSVSGSQLLSLVVDEALRGWEIWEAIRDDTLDIEFRVYRVPNVLAVHEDV